MVSYGAESVSKAQRKRYGKGHPSDEGFLKRVNSEWFQAGACYVGNSYVFGDTNDSAEDISEFGRYARELDPGYIEPLYSQPYPGTPYREELKERGLLNERGSQWDFFTEGRMLVKHPELDEPALQDLRVKMWLDFFSPRKAIRQLWMFQYLFENLGVSRDHISVLMAKSTYTLFGCYLEDKYYAHRYPDMLEAYFREVLPKFAPEEMDMSDRIDGVTDMLGMRGLKSAFANFDLRIKINDGGKCLATFVFQIREKKAISARAYAGKAPSGYASLSVSVPLSTLKEALISPPTGLKKALSSSHLLLGNLPRVAFDTVKLAGRRFVA